MFYFAYGSNLLRPRLEARIGPVAGKALVAAATGYELRFHKRGADGSGKADAHPVQGGEIVGGLYQVSDQQIARLDPYEQGYRRQPLSVTSRDRTCMAWTYFAEDAVVDSALRPFDWYVALIATGAGSLGLPQPYLEAIKTHPAIADPDAARAAANRRVLTLR